MVKFHLSYDERVYMSYYDISTTKYIIRPTHKEKDRMDFIPRNCNKAIFPVLVYFKMNQLTFYL